MKRSGILVMFLLLALSLNLYAAGDMIVNGNLGIGVASPVQRLEIAGGHAVLNSNRLVLLSRDDISYYYITGAAWNTGLEYHYYSGHRFYTDTDAVTPKVTITQSGSVGIGTTEPAGQLEIRRDAAGESYADGLVLKNTTAATASVRQYPPAINLFGHGWNGSADESVEWRIVNDPTTWGNPTLRIFLRRGGGAWSEVQCIDSAGQFEHNIRFAAYDARETQPIGLDLGNDADATASYDQNSPVIRWRGKGWKSGDSTSRYISWNAYLEAAAGSSTQEGSLKFSYGVDTTDPNTELLRLSSAGRVGISTSAPTSKLDVTGSAGYSQFRMRTTYTPSSSADANGNTGDVAWDAGYVYIKTASGWKRATLSTF
jgi:hypothetical protein